MVYLIMATYEEAAYWIEKLALKKERQLGKMQLFYGQSARLVISGMGSIQAATGLTWLCSLYPPARQDALINFGICGSNHKADLNQVFLCNLLEEQESHRTFYPDLLYGIPAKEAALQTAMIPYTQGEQEDQEQRLYDMEACGIYQSGILFFQTHKMFFIKAVTDSDGAPDRQRLKSQVRNLSQHGFELAENLCQLLEEEEKNLIEKTRSKMEFPEIQKLEEDLCCSVTMSFELKQLIRYFQLEEIQYGPLIETWYQKKELPCKSKKQGQIYLKKLKQELL